MERYLKLTIAYDGTAYHGFQRQANAMTVQQVLEERLPRIFGHPLKVTGASRTDSGVHAYGQVVNFRTIGSIPTASITAAAKSVLPSDIVVKAAEEVDEAFHSRFSAQSKIYLYRILNEPVADPFRRNYCWQVPGKLDVRAMDDTIQVVLGTHDFSAFKATGGPPVSPVKTIYEAGCRQLDGEIELRFWGDGFLYHMVRNLVGTLVDVGLGRLDRAGFQAILEGLDRKAAGITAPPQGLFLKEIFYSLPNK